MSVIFNISVILSSKRGKYTEVTTKGKKRYILIIQSITKIKDGISINGLIQCSLHFIVTCCSIHYYLPVYLHYQIASLSTFFYNLVWHHHDLLKRSYHQTPQYQRKEIYLPTTNSHLHLNNYQTFTILQTGNKTSACGKDFFQHETDAPQNAFNILNVLLLQNTLIHASSLDGHFSPHQTP